MPNETPTWPSKPGSPEPRRRPWYLSRPRKRRQERQRRAESPPLSLEALGSLRQRRLRRQRLLRLRHHLWRLRLRLRFLRAQVAAWRHRFRGPGRTPNSNESGD